VNQRRTQRTRRTQSSFVFLCVLCVLCVPRLARSPAAQQTPTDTDKTREVTVTGCLAHDVDGRYTLIGGHAEPLATNEPVGTVMSTEPAGSGTRPAGAIVWRLTGGTDLDRHVGHRVQITGRTATSSATELPATTTDTKGPQLEVQSIKEIASDCS